MTIINVEGLPFTILVVGSLLVTPGWISWAAFSWFRFGSLLFGHFFYYEKTVWSVPCAVLFEYFYYLIRIKGTCDEGMIRNGKGGM
jgi:hypothetical protein